MNRLMCTLAVVAIAIQGCSFRAPAPAPGRIIAVHGGETNAGEPVRLRADVVFTGSVESPTLAILSMPEIGPLRIAAYGTPSGPWMGLGVFPVDRTSERHMTLEATVVLPKPGVYRVEGLSARPGEVETTEVTAVADLHAQ